MLIVMSGIVVVINTVLAQTLVYISTLEGHPSQDGINASTTRKVFLALFMNTALLVLLINAAMPAAVSSVRVGDVPVFTGNYASFDVRWHTVVGVSIVLTMVINTFSVHWCGGECGVLCT